jgi:hypothetical protein
MPQLRASLLACVALLLAGCASYDGRGLRPGVATDADVRQLMGTPAAVWREPDGGTTLAYPRGPAGLQTFMAHIGSGGKLTSIEQVLDEQHFRRVVTQQMTEQDVTRLLGPPYRTMRFAMRDEVAWDYRFYDAWGYGSVFSVIFAADGRVTGTFTAREQASFPRASQ